MGDRGRTMLAMETAPRTPYDSDVSDEEWAFLAPYLTLMREDAPQRTHDLRELFNGLRFIARTGLQWRFMPHDLPPWSAVYQQTRRWLAAEVFDAIERLNPYAPEVRRRFFDLASALDAELSGTHELT